MTRDEELITKTLNFCAAVAKNGIRTESKIYGKEALDELLTNPEMVSRYILEHLNEDDHFHGTVAMP